MIELLGWEDADLSAVDLKHGKFTSWARKAPSFMAVI